MDRREFPQTYHYLHRYYDRNLTGDYLWEDKPAVDENGFRAVKFAV
uniref:Uncharacterized protein n=1 Tax=Rhizobium rhizogenes TaxID=359 RepID=A0A7S5DQP3_RHIRH|nr:hypothetical protein [Rhizobium rhizogenes]QCL10524.1 hypothetical protein pC6.5c_631 [Rhizobium rhizogenes]